MHCEYRVVSVIATTAPDRVNVGMRPTLEPVQPDPTSGHYQINSTVVMPWATADQPRVGAIVHLACTPGE